MNGRYRTIMSLSQSPQYELESISMSPGQVRTVPMASVGKIIVGSVMVLLALFAFVPVAVNLPDSWPGALISGLLGLTGVIRVVVAAREMHVEPKQVSRRDGKAF